MILYEIQFSKKVDETEEAEILGDGIELSEEESLVGYGNFYMGAPDWDTANDRAKDFLLKFLEGKPYEIIKVEARQDIWIANWGEPDECDCPYCAVATTPQEDIMKFACSCGEELIVADNGWESLPCKNIDCDNTISRKDIKEVNGKWIYAKT